jgi:hypothetical protein
LPVQQRAAKKTTFVGRQRLQSFVSVLERRPVGGLLDPRRQSCRESRVGRGVVEGTLRLAYVLWLPTIKIAEHGSTLMIGEPHENLDSGVHTVLSAMIFRSGAKEELLLGVRRPTPLVQRFPGVLSTPTMGIPPRLYQLLDPEQTVELGFQNVVSAAIFTVGRGGYLGNEAAFALEHLMARKLELAEALTDNKFRGQAQLLMRSYDQVSDPLGTNETFWTRMLTYEVIIEEGSEQVPTATNSYSRLLWAPVSSARRAILERDALLLDDTLNPFEVCIHGLCLRSIVTLL